MKEQIVYNMQTTSPSVYQCKEVSSFKIFKRFTKYYPDGRCDASAIIGKECYDCWVKSRKAPPKSPHEAFRRAVTAHIRGNDGRKPFPEEAERSLLKELRKKKQWDAFVGTPYLVGVKGFTSLGHHEKQRSGLEDKKSSKKRSRAEEEYTSKLSHQKENTYQQKKSKGHYENIHASHKSHPVKLSTSLKLNKDNTRMLAAGPNPYVNDLSFCAKYEQVKGIPAEPLLNTYHETNPIAVHEGIPTDQHVYNIPFGFEGDDTYMEDPFLQLDSDSTLDDFLGVLDLRENERMPILTM